MLKRLYVYDLEAGRRLMIPFLFSTVGLGAIAMLLFFIAEALPEKLSIISAGLFFLYALCILGILLLFAACFCLVVYRYYKNFFTDEGYLTFVLPTDMKTQVLAKTLSGFTWVILAFFAVCAGFTLALTPPISNMEGEQSLAEFFRMLFTAFLGEAPPAVMVPVLISLGIGNMLVGSISGLLLLYTAITLGSLIIRGHKILGSILFYFVVTGAVNAISQIFSGIIIGLARVGLSPAAEITVSLALTLLLNLGLAIGCFFLVSSLLEKKLNLE